MDARILGVVVATGLIASAAAGAQTVTGDIVDQILHPNAQPAADPSPPPVAATLAPSPAPAALPPAAPTPLTPQPAAPPFPASTVTGPDIVDTAPAAATPLPLPPSLDSRWSGFYAGINLGGGWTEGSAASTCINSVTGDSSGCTVINQSGPNTAGLLGGGQVGYLAPVHLGPDMPPLIVGGEIDLQGSGISGGQNVPPPIPLVNFPPCTTCNFSAHQSLGWLSSVRLRVGVPLGDVLVYGTGGYMFGGGQVSQSITFTNAVGSYSASAKETLSGPTFGGGIEFRLPGPWSARLEALYFDLGKMRTVAEPINGAFVNFSNTKTFVFRGGIIRLALNVKLGDIGFGF